MSTLNTHWKIRKNMKPAAKSFREAIDFPTDSFETPKKSNTFSLKSHTLSRSPHLAKARSSKHDTDESGYKSNVKNSFLSSRKLSRTKKSESRSVQKANGNTSKNLNSKNSISKTFNSSFNDSFNDLFFNNTSKFSDDASNSNIIPLQSSIKKTTNVTEDFKNEDCLSVVQNFEPKKNLSHKTHRTLSLEKSTNHQNGLEDSLRSEWKNIENAVTIDDDKLNLSRWGLPETVVDAYRSQNITTMFKWQAECLSLENVLKGGNLVYSAPTSAGKTLVAEILMLKKVVETKRKGLMILPFVSVAREKVNYLQKLFGDAGVTVDGYMGTYNPPGGFNVVDVAICTIEKANNLINRLIEDGRIDQIGIIVVDELHMLGDPHRGYLLELLLTKLLYTCKKNNIDYIQIVGMSATLPNLNILSSWLQANLYHTDFRPVPLHETFKVGPYIYDSKSFQLERSLKTLNVTFANDFDHTIYLAMETVLAGHAVLIFCPTKNWCENLAESIAREVFKLGKMSPDSNENSTYKCMGSRLREVLNGDQLKDILDQLSSSPAGLDNILGCTVPFGVAFHHAGLTFDERDIIEGAFRCGIVKFLVATSTLSSGVNLPAKRVIIRSPLFRGTLIDVLTYKQMIGRAGRKGIDTSGESILLCKESEKNFAKTLVESELRPVRSCMIMSDNGNLHSSIKRAILEIIASGVAQSPSEINQYTSCTLLAASLTNDQRNGSESSGTEIEHTIEKCLQFLIENEFISLTETKEEGISKKIYQPTRLGQAVLASGFSPDDSLRMLKELQLARRCFVLENDLHILYEVTPPYLSDQIGEINWLHYLSLWEQLPDDKRRVGELVGIEEQFIGCRMQGRAITKLSKNTRKLAIHQRFYAALALNDLIQEIPLSVVSRKYNCTRGILQSLQQTTSTFAGMLTIFCNKLGWYNLELLFGQFQKRVHFGIQQELCNLVRLSSVNGQKARMLYNAGYETVVALANADISQIAFLLRTNAPFESDKQQEGETAHEALRRKEAKNIWISGCSGLNNREAAEIIVKEARRMIERELGVKSMPWKSSELENVTEYTSTKTEKKDRISIHNTNADGNPMDEERKRTLLYDSNSSLDVPRESDGSKKLKKQISTESTSDGEHAILTNGIETINQFKKPELCSVQNTNKRKYATIIDDQHTDSPISTSDSLRTIKKGKTESDSAFEDDQFSFLINSTFNCTPSLVPESKSNKNSSDQVQAANWKNTEQSIKIAEDDDDPFEDFALSQVAEMESIYLSHSLKCKLQNDEDEVNTDHDAVSNQGSHVIISDSPLVSHKVNGLSVFCSSTPFEKFITKPSIQSHNSPFVKPQSLYKCRGRNHGMNSTFIKKSRRNYAANNGLLTGVNEPVKKLVTPFNDCSLTRSQALRMCEKTSFDEENPTFLTYSEKRDKINGQSVQEILDTPIEKLVKKTSIPLNDCSLTKSQALHICEKTSFDEESSTISLACSEKSDKTNEQSVQEISDTPIEKLVKKTPTSFNDCSLIKSQALHVCEKASFDEESPIFLAQSEKNCKISGQSMQETVYTPTKKLVKKLSSPFKDCSLTKSQALYMCEETSFDKESSIFLAQSEKNCKTNGQSTQETVYAPIEKLVKKTSIPFKDCSLTKSQTLHMCEEASFSDENQVSITDLKINYEPEKQSSRNSNPIKKSEKTLKQFDNYSLTESRAAHICAKISFDEENQIFIPETEETHKANCQPIPFTPVEKRMTVSEKGIFQFNDCRSIESQCEKICSNDQSPTSLAKSRRNEFAAPSTSITLEKSIDKRSLTQSNDYSLTKSQAVYMCEKMSFWDENLSFIAKTLEPKSHFTESFKSIKDTNNNNGFTSALSTTEDPDAELFPESNENDVLETNDIQGLSKHSKVNEDLDTALNFSPALSILPKISDVKNGISEYQNNNVPIFKSKGTFYEVSDLSFNLDTERELKGVPEEADVNGLSSILAGRNAPFGKNSIPSKALSPINAEIDSSGSTIDVSPTPPKISLFAKGVLANHAQTPNKSEVLTPLTNHRVKSNDLGLNSDLFSNSPVVNATNIRINLFDVSQTSSITSEEQNAVAHSESILANNSIALQEDEANFSVELEAGISVKIIEDDVSFKELMNDWRKISKFSISVACEKFVKSHRTADLQTKGNSSDLKKCQWLFGTDRSIVGIGLCWEKDCVFYIPFICRCSQGVTTNSSILTCVQKLEDIRNILCKPISKKTVSIHDLKSQYKVLCDGCGIVLPQSQNMVYQDPSVAAWMLDPDAGEQSLCQLSSNYLPTKVHLLEGYKKKIGGLGLQCESATSAQKRVTTEAFIVFELMNEMRVPLRTKKLYRAFSEIEMPILFLLAKMEMIGFGLDAKLTVRYRTDLQQKQLQLLQKAHELAGRKFNLSSSKDTARVLYKELRLSTPDNSCSNYSTNQYLSLRVSTYKKSQRIPPSLKTNKETLETLKHVHPLPKIILDWRKVSFSLSKVLMPLLKEKKFCRDMNIDRLHGTSYIYTVTGRVNMHSPNLQFTPRDFDVADCGNEERNPNGEETECPDSEICGISLRNVFIPSKGCVLLSADYSQLELRMLAHLSRDRKLISLLNSGSDVFKMIASSWKKIAISEVSDALRQQAKQICYGMIYGIGPKTLSHQLGVDEEDAAVFMDSFKDAYPNVKEYLKKIIENCKTQDYITTLGHRKRYLPSINSAKNGERARAERQAVNTTIQGSAADLFKLAMIKIEAEMKKRFPDSFQPFSYQVNAGSVAKRFRCSSGGFLVLQLHDELIFEVFERDLKPVAHIIRNNMENCMKLSVKLPVKVRIGSSWGNMTEMKSI